MFQLFRVLTLSLAAIAATNASADIHDTAEERALSLPAGKPALVIKKEDWVISREQRRQGDTAVYYLLASERIKMVLSAYIDQTNACDSSESCLQAAMKNQSYRDAKELKVIDVGSFKAAQFYLDQPQGAPVKQAHVLAAAYLDGHWFDIHISKTDRERPDLNPLIDLLKSLSIR